MGNVSDNKKNLQANAKAYVEKVLENPAQRRQICQMEVAKILERYGCIIVPTIVIRGDGHIEPIIDIVPVDNHIQGG